MDILNKDELLQMEDLCIQEQPPAAMAACPLRVECRTLCMAMKDGDFDVARAVYTKTVTLPHSLSYLCRMPCQEACLRKDLGGAIEMRGLEWAAMQYGKAMPSRLLRRKKSGKAAVIGSGPFGLTAAIELSKKGFSVSLFEADNKLGGSLLRADLPEEALEADIQLAVDQGVEFHLNETIENPKDLPDPFDAVVLATGEIISGTDPFTLQSPVDGVFSGGGYDSLVETIAAGKRAANSVDRYVKRVSMTAGREKEMERGTTLFVETSYFDSLPSDMGPFPNQEEAIREASRCIDCQCMECAKACAFIAHYKRYPKLYLREIYNNLSIALGNHTSNTLINSCALCSQCEVVCPNGLDLGKAIQSARNRMVKTGKMPPTAFEFAVDDMRQANSEHSFFFRHEPETSSSRYLFFPGCQLGASAPDTVQKTYEWLTETLDGGVAFMHGCCGVMAKWAGEEELYEKTQDALKEAWEALGKPRIITACPTCHKTLLESIDGEIKDIWHILLEKGVPAIEKPLPLTMHDACGARYMDDTREAVRAILKNLGCEVHEPSYTDERSPCCGYGGLVQFSNTEVAKELTEFCIRDIDETRLTYCMGCRDRFSKAGARTVHLLELIFEGEKEDRKAPGYSLRQDNREWLKRRMLSERWKETQQEVIRLKLTYDDDLGELLEERLILEEDVRKVITDSLESDCFIEEKKTGLRIAHKQIGNVTYWVYFTPEDEGYRVRRAYSHRMEIL